MAVMVYRLIIKILIMTIQMNFDPIPVNRACNWMAVISSSSIIRSSTILCISRVIFEGLPEPGLLAMDPVVINFLINFAIPIREVVTVPSSFSSFAIVGGRYPCW